MDDSYESTLVLKIKADFWAHVMTFQRNEYLTSTWSKSTIPYRYIQYNFCLNLPITHWDMKENLSGCFFWTHCIMIKIKHRSTLDSLLCSPTTRVACHCVQHFHLTVHVTSWNFTSCNLMSCILSPPPTQTFRKELRDYLRALLNNYIK